MNGAAHDTSFGSEHHTRLVTLHGMRRYADRTVFDADRARHTELIRDRRDDHQAQAAAFTDPTSRTMFEQYGPAGCGAHVTELLPGMRVVVGHGEYRDGRPATVRTLHASHWGGVVMVDFAGPIAHLLAHVPVEHRTRRTRRYFRAHHVPATDCQPIDDTEFEHLIASIPAIGSRW